MCRRSLVLAFACFAAVALGQTVQLTLKFPKGRADRMTTAMTSTQSFVAPGSSQEMSGHMAQSTTMLMRVLRSDAKGATVKVTYEALKSSMTMNGQPMPITDPKVEKAIKGKSILLDFTPSGALSSIRGFDQIMAASKGSMPPAVQQSFKQIFNEKSIRDMWAMSFNAFYPNRPIRVGESWPAHVNFGQPPMAMDFKLKMTLQGVESRGGRRMAKIGVSGTGTLDVSNFGGNQMKMKTDRFDIFGTAYFDLDRGWLSDQNMAMRVHALMTVPQQKAPVAITMNMSMTSKVTPAK